MKECVSKVIDPLINQILDSMKELSSPQEQVGQGEVITPPKPVKVSTNVVEQSQQAQSSTENTSSTTTTKLTTKTFKQKITFHVSSNMLYETLLDQPRVCAFTGGPAKVENKPGTEFFLFDGAVQGIQQDLVPHTKIVQKWRFNSWPENHYSTVTLSFESAGDRTNLNLVQTGIPSSDYDRTREGWETFFWRRIRGLFNWGYELN
eukprot:TRINITY_DN938_c0_g1_i4.p1 TRINITY_DN938_c0_g1~~TRINITY_DN938_c0_g1_i4.p1  ORF type:complete len:205 (-),score=52.04 TRINITY_DN938_c0_g1_i4:182-796(-)